MTPVELKKLEDEIRERKQALWHGGFPGLRVGEMVLPPTRSGSTGMAEEAERVRAPRVISSSDRVYVTTDRRLAAAVAANFPNRFPTLGRGWVYRVELGVHSLELDADLPRGPFICFQLPDARIASVGEKEVDPKDPKHFNYMTRIYSTVG